MLRRPKTRLIGISYSVEKTDDRGRLRSRLRRRWHGGHPRLRICWNGDRDDVGRQKLGSLANSGLRLSGGVFNRHAVIGGQ